MPNDVQTCQICDFLAVEYGRWQHFDAKKLLLLLQYVQKSADERTDPDTEMGPDLSSQNS